jgi:hypothetical protein
LNPVLNRILGGLVDGMELLISYVLGLAIFILFFPNIANNIDALSFTRILNVTPAQFMASLTIYVLFWSLGISVWNILFHKERYNEPL